MRSILFTLKWLFRLIISAIILVLVWIGVTPPELLKVGTSYSAKIACSNVFIAGRDAEKVLKDDVQAPGNPILRTVMLDVDEAQQKVTARILGYAAARSSIYRPGFGCTNIADDALAVAELPPPPDVVAVNDKIEWPEGNHAGTHYDSALSEILSDEVLRGPGMRAIVVVQHGRIIGEAYAPGFTEKTPLIGWSMTKSVNAILAGLVEKDGRLSFADRNLFAQWANDDRKEISLASLAAMQSGLAFNEDYGDVSDVTRMLFLEGNMAEFVTSKATIAMLDAQFNYSTGSSVAISRYWMGKMPDKPTAYAFPRKALFNPLGMESAVLEVDQTGTFVGGSYLYATARDWARIGQFLLQNGVWNGQQLLPEGFVGLMRQANSTSRGEYSQMQTWLAGTFEEPNAKFGIPEDAFWLKGHDGQTVAVIPSKDMVIVRMGLTPSRLRYVAQTLVGAIVQKMP